MKKVIFAVGTVFLAGLLSTILPCAAQPSDYQYKETENVVNLVNDAARLIEKKGEAAFPEFRIKDSAWRRGNQYIFVLDARGNMIIHPDPALEGKNQIGLEDVNGKLIAAGLIKIAVGYKNKSEGWFHYQWPEPGNIFPEWKSVFARSVISPSGKKYIVCCGLYDARMEKGFAVELADMAAEKIEKSGEAAFKDLRDPAGEFLSKDTYVFVIGPDGKNLVDPAFPSLEGTDMLSIKDAGGKETFRDMMETVKADGYGWVDYMWPRPGDYIPSMKSSYVKKAVFGDKWFLVGCGVYTGSDPKEESSAFKLNTVQVIRVVADAAKLLQEKGENGFPEFKKEVERWEAGDTYIFVLDTDGNMIIHPDPAIEGKNQIDLKDARGRPIVRMFIRKTSESGGTSWTHYLWPKPGSIFSTWKSTFVKKVIVPSGRAYIVGCGIYNMKMEEKFIIDVVDEAAALIEKEGPAAFDLLRDKTGPFVFLDTYIFVDTPEGVEVVNGGFPSVEGKNILDFRDANGKYLTRECIDMALKNGTGWVDYFWPKPGEAKPSKKHTYVKKVEYGDETFIVACGAYF